MFTLVLLCVMSSHLAGRLKKKPILKVKLRKAWSYIAQGNSAMLEKHSTLGILKLLYFKFSTQFNRLKNTNTSYSSLMNIVITAKNICKNYYVLP